MSGQLDFVESLVLASASSRRAELLEQIGVDFIQRPANITEKKNPTESAEDFVLRMAKEKAECVFHALADESKSFAKNKHNWVLASDTSIVLGEQVLGKPTDFEHAQAMWESMSNTKHQVLTSLYLMNNQRHLTLLSKNVVVFDAICTDQMHDYWQSGEPQDKAGGYAVQGKAALWIRSIAGSYSSIMGLPLFETGQLLTEAGFSLWP